MIDTDFAQLTELMIPAAHRAGTIIMEHFNAGVAVELKSDASPVTVADHESENVILRALADKVPDIPVVSEESVARGHRPQSAERFFLVDPLDGTKEFINRDPDFTVNIGLVEGSTPLFGLIYAPAHRKIFMTLSANEAVCAELASSEATPSLSGLNLEEMHTRAPGTASLTALASRSHMNADTERFIEDHKISQIRRAGSSLKFCLLALGEADVYPRLAPTMEWDTAAGDAILRAAGGIVLDESGAPLAYGKWDASFRNSSFIAWGRAPQPG